VNVDELEVVDGRAYENLEGWIPELASEEDLRTALEKAFDYRGDITLTFKNGERSRLTSSIAIPARWLADSYVQYFASNAPDKRKVSYAEIARHRVHRQRSRRRQALGSVVQKYAEKKAAGEKNIALHPEALD
jgi:hypothetical protein